jgi:hypothetical protein
MKRLSILTLACAAIMATSGTAYAGPNDGSEDFSLDPDMS